MHKFGGCKVPYLISMSAVPLYTSSRYLVQILSKNMNKYCKYLSTLAPEADAKSYLITMKSSACQWLIICIFNVIVVQVRVGSKLGPRYDINIIEIEKKIVFLADKFRD